ncbi:MAG: reverse transcriptase domain-containing protein, partial [Thermoguttaceae bacterium]
MRFNSPFCTNCRASGHRSSECQLYRSYQPNPALSTQSNAQANLSYQYNNARTGFDTANPVITKIRRIEQLLGKRIEGKVADLAATLPKNNTKLNGYWQLLSPDFDAFRTLRKNEALVDEVLKALENYRPINTLTTYETKEFDITKCIFEIHNQPTCAIIDSGASFSVVSKSFAEKIGLPINIAHQENLLLANNQTAKSHGNVSGIPLRIADKVFHCDAIVLPEAAQTLLIGVNFLKKYNAMIKYENNSMTLTSDGNTTSIPISTDKIYRSHTLTENTQGSQSSFILKSAENITLEPFSTHQVNIQALDYVSVPSGSIFFVSSFHPELHVAKGIFDALSPIQTLMVANLSYQTQHLYSCTPIASVEICEGAAIFDPSTFDCAFEPGKILASFKGDENSKKKFEVQLNELACEKIEQKCIPLQHKIVLKEDTPQICSKQYRTNLRDKEKIEEQISEMLQHNVIRESSSEYSSPIVLVKKKDNTTRFCIDYRILNRHTIKNRYPIPRLDDTIDSLKHANFFSKIDLKNGYWHVPINELDKKKTAFRSHIGLYEFNVMPFGLTNAPSTFQHIMNTIFYQSNWQFSLIYLDDVIIYSRTETDHLKNVIDVLREIRRYNLQINYKKSEFFTNKIEYLGYIVEKDGITISTEKTDAIRYYPIPKTKKQIQQFIGLVSYYRRFIENFAKIVGPLNKIMKKDVAYCWKDEQQNCFDLLRSLLIKSPILRIPDMSKQFIVRIDACAEGLGAILAQTGEFNHEHVIAYASRTCNSYEKNYCAYELEALGLDYALKTWKCYLLSLPFIVYTDNRALQYIKEKKDLSGRLTRFLLRLEEFDFTICHKPGRENLAADALSRNAINTIFKTEKGDYDLNLNDPDTQRKKKEIILEHHANIGHASPSNTYKSLKKYFFWRTMRTDVNEIVQNCSECLIFNDGRAPQFNYPLLIGEVFERIGLDTIGPLTESSSGNRYIFLAIDYLSKYIFIRAVKTKSAEE